MLLFFVRPHNPSKSLHRTLIIVLFSVCAHTAFGNALLLPAKLRCEYMENPLGIANQIPRFTWLLSSEKRNQHQSAYEIVISDQLTFIKQTKGNIWQTGKVNTDQSVNIEYKGAALKPFTRYYWRVRVYDQDGEASSWSEMAWFETAMLSATDWKAAWIDDGKKQFEKPEDFYSDDPMPLFRKTFDANKKIEAARLYVCGLGYYEAYLNGQKIGDHVLDPGWTTHRKESLYVTYDISSMIRKGSNTAGIMLGNGWYNPLPIALFGRFNLRNVQQTGRPCVKAQIHIRYTDGSEETIITDESWQTATGPVVRNNVYLGEYYDARLERRNWSSNSAKNEVWKNAVITEGPTGELTPQIAPPVRITKIVKPVKISEVGKDTFLIDMGQNFAGVARIRVSGAAGTKISLRYGEDIHSTGRLNFLTSTAGQIKEIWNLKGGPGAPKTAWQQDTYILNGNGQEQWAPRFTFHGFRYVEITGWPGKPTLNDIEGLRMNSDLIQQGNFSCSNEMFNRLQDVIRWTFLSNVFSVQSDCPAREKMGYGADIVVTAEAFMYNFDMANFYRKTVRDYANEQQADGGITETAPYTGIADRGYGGASGPLGWELAFPFLQKKLYEFYGDKRIIEENYAGVQKQLDFLKSKEIGGLFHWDISDHEALDPRPEAFTASVFYYNHVLLAADFAGILNKKEDSIKYASWSRRIKAAIVRKYLVPNTGRFDNATQSAQLFALSNDLSTTENDASMQVLINEYARHNWHLSTGIFGTKMMFDVMRLKNQNEIAYRIANQRTFPGWGYMLENDATTLWESWEKPDSSTSMNHPMFGSVTEWFYRSILGINPDTPGFKKIIIKPQPAGDLTWAKGDYNSIHGIIGSDWKKDATHFILNVSIPANTSAEIWIPTKEKNSVTENGKSVTTIEGIRVARYENGYVVIEIGSGNYVFKAAL